ncbi:hypothetical protein JG687_00017850 [Phytophthora cactorum]|uniref:Uncharacterized protein n=1 Tax=Phytophthora cactorum TaxID=29920 RepID=A0A8T1TQC2_9STRA|nr:hypothetical protein JG687_00017850 [Phytophthora cactorum]
MDGVKPDIELDEYYESLLWQQRRTKTVKSCSLADWSNLSSNRKNWRNNQTANGYNKNSLDDVSRSMKAGDFWSYIGRPRTRASPCSRVWLDMKMQWNAR